MTTEGRPELKGSDEYWKKEFKQQRKDRLQDSVDEYMQDNEVSQFYEDLINILEELIGYHEKQKYHAQLAMKAISGHRPLDINAGITSLTGPDSDEPVVLKHEYNRREAEYYNKRAQLDLGYQPNDYYWDKDRNKPYVAADGYSVKDYNEIPDRY
jgi:hypothetical protein